MAKIIHIIDTIDLGGAQTVVKGILEQSGTDCFLYACRTKPIRMQVDHANVIVHQGKSRFGLSPIFELRKIIEKQQIEILHCHLFRSQVIGWILKVLYFPKIKLIFHEHGQIFGTTSVENFFFFNFVKIAKKKVNLFIAVSNATAEHLIEKTKVSRGKIKTLYNFVDLSKYDTIEQSKARNEFRTKEKIPNSTVVLGTAGRLSRIKGFEYLIRALPHLEFEYLCVIAGEGELKADLVDLAKKLDVKEKVEFLGYVEQMSSIYPAFDLYVMPSLREASPMTFYEAQAFGLPVIGSNVEAINEFVIEGRNGSLFESKNFLDIAEKLNQLVSDQDLYKKMSKNAEDGISGYSLTAFINNLNDFYNMLLESGSDLSEMQ